MPKARANPRRQAAARAVRAAPRPGRHGLPGQVVLVLQGGGALGAYQGGVYQAMHEAGIEPDWVIGTSIGAINAALIAGNAPRAGWSGCVRSGVGRVAAARLAARCSWSGRQPALEPAT